MAIRINGTERDSQTNEMSTFVHGARHLAANKNIYEPQRTNDFEFVVTDLDDLVGVNGEQFTNAQEMIRIAVVNGRNLIPHFSIAPINVRHGNGNLRFAGLPEFSSGSFTIQDWIGAQTKEILLAWQHLAYNVNTEKVGLSSEYKKRCYLIELTPDKQTVRRWVLEGCWISEISESDRSHTNSEANEISATVQYDLGWLDTQD